MERKLWIKLCALLLLFMSALASHDNEYPPVDSNTTERPTVPGLDETAGASIEESAHLNVFNNNTESRPGGSTISTTDKDTMPLTPLIKSNGTVLNSSGLPEVKGTFTFKPNPSLHEAPPTQKSPPSSTVSISTNQNNTSTVATLATTTHVAITNASQHIVPSKPTRNATTASSPVPQMTVTSSSTKPTTTLTSTQPGTPAPKPKVTTAVSVHTDGPNEVPSPSAHAKAHIDTPSQLNLGGGTTAVQEAPTLDPLLAGLVSAFIITAIIITLLLFLKLRRRDTRPQFRRLQDLPMDDMEDTPLSMYSY